MERMPPAPIDKLTLVMLGRSGSGKSVQVERIERHFGRAGHRIETGAFLRSLAARRHPTARIARPIIEGGRLVPGWLATFVWLRDLIERGVGDKHLIFDGAPRVLWEARLLDEVMRWHRRPQPYCVYIDTSRREAERRLRERGRNDDTPAAIRRRMDYFVTSVRPVLRHYRERGRLIRIDGDQPVDAVWRGLVRALRRRRLATF